MNVNNKTVFAVKGGPILKARVLWLDDDESLMAGSTKPILYKHTDKAGVIRYYLYCVDIDTSSEIDWSTHWPAGLCEAILLDPESGDPTYLNEDTFCSDDRRLRNCPSKYTMKDFTPSFATDDNGAALYNITLSNISPDIPTILKLSEDIDVAPDIRKIYKSVLQAHSNGRNQTVKTMVLNGVSDILTRINDTLGIPVVFTVESMAPIVQPSIASIDLPDWAWWPLSCYTHSGTWWNLASTDRINVSGVVYMTAEHIQHVEEVTKNMSVSDKHKYQSKELRRLWNTYCKPVLDGELCEEVKCLVFDTNGVHVDTEYMFSGLYGSVYDEYYHREENKLQCLRDFIAGDVKGAATNNGATMEDITDLLIESSEYDLPVV